MPVPIQSIIPGKLAGKSILKKACFSDHPPEADEQ
jgi:hypothetical protein